MIAGKLRTPFANVPRRPYRDADGRAVGARSVGGQRRPYVDAGAGRHDPAGAGRGTTRIRPFLGGRAPQHAHRRQHLPGRADRPPGRGDGADPRRIGWRDAPQPRSAGDRRAVRDARGAPSRTDRPRHRARAGHRSDDRFRLRPPPARQRATVSPRRDRRDGDARRPPRRGRHVDAVPRHTRRRYDTARRPARLLRIQRSAGRHARHPVRLRPPLRHRRHRGRFSALPRSLHAVAGARSSRT